MTKYYCITAFTSFCGEETNHYLAIESNDCLNHYDAEIDDWVCDNAESYWYYHEDEYECFEDYLAECSWEEYEISEAEYIYCTKGE